jgi:hypothetical protein
MNRQHRRYQERHERKQQRPTLASLPRDIKDDITAVARAPTFIVGGGTCAFRAFTGMSALMMAGIEAQHCIGGMIYRAGDDDHRDVVAFCGIGNVGCIRDGKLLGHTWLRVGNNLIDFSAGDWRRETEMVPMLLDDGLGDIDWKVEPPEYFWGLWDFFMPPTNVGGTCWTPELGRAWYTGFNGDAEARQWLEADKTMMEPVELALPSQLELAKRLRLRQRVENCLK